MLQVSNMNNALLKQPKIAVIGSGAMGCFYGACLAREGNVVNFLMRSDAVHVRQHGLQIRSCEGDFCLPEVNVFTQTETMGQQDLVLITLKSTDNHVLPQLLEPIVGEQTTILTLQNGLGNEEFLAKYFDTDHVMGGVCFVCLNRTAPGVIQHFKHGHMEIGEIVGKPIHRTEAVAELFIKAGIRCAMSENLSETLWRKLVWNVPFNGLAISEGGVDVSVLLAHSSLEKRVKALMEEVIEAAFAMNVEIPQSFIADQIDKTKVMGPYSPSSLIDYKMGRAVEVEAIWGEPLRIAQKKGLPMPELNQLYDSLKHLCVKDS